QEYRKKIDRKRYGAPVGYVFPKNNETEIYVAIRNVQWNSGTMFIAAGGGIVPASTIEKEWAEVNLKFDAIREMLAL
ncbi:MAG: chorismate-binding protein, partial [Parachlamydiaceae bacterium]